MTREETFNWLHELITMADSFETLSKPADYTVPRCISGIYSGVYHGEKRIKGLQMSGLRELAKKLDCKLYTIERDDEDYPYEDYFIFEDVAFFELRREDM